MKICGQMIIKGVLKWETSKGVGEAKMEEEEPSKGVISGEVLFSA